MLWIAKISQAEVLQLLPVERNRERSSGERRWGLVVGYGNEGCGSPPLSLAWGQTAVKCVSKSAQKVNWRFFKKSGIAFLKKRNSFCHSQNSDVSSPRQSESSVGHDSISSGLKKKTSLGVSPSLHPSLLPPNRTPLIHTQHRVRGTDLVIHGWFNCGSRWRAWRSRGGPAPLINTPTGRLIHRRWGNTLLSR